jgi:hypothetical protein
MKLQGSVIWNSPNSTSFPFISLSTFHEEIIGRLVEYSNIHDFGKQKNIHNFNMDSCANQ